MTQTVTHSITVTQADVLYVSTQVQKDLRALRTLYPNVVSEQRLYSLTDAVTIFLLHSMVTKIGFALVDQHTDVVYQELEYKVSYTGSGPRVGTGGAALARLNLPASTELLPWVNWMSAFLALPADKQQILLQGTGWGLPGSAGSRMSSLKRIGGTYTNRATYASGPLSVDAREYRR